MSPGYRDKSVYTVQYQNAGMMDNSSHIQNGSIHQQNFGHNLSPN
jgi:hypothetical protein